MEKIVWYAIPLVQAVVVHHVGEDDYMKDLKSSKNPKEIKNKCQKLLRIVVKVVVYA